MIGFVIKPCCFEEDSIVFTLELFTILKNCPSHLSETWRLSKFFEHLLNNHNLRTVLTATLRTIQSSTSRSIEMSMWYRRMDAKYKISLGKTLIGLSNTRELAKLATLDLPYLEDYKEDINQCLTKGLCDNLPNLASDRAGRVWITTICFAVIFLRIWISC